MGHKKRKQGSDTEDDVEHSASDSDVSDSKAKKSKSKQSTSTKGKSSSTKTKTAKKPKIDASDDESTHEEKATPRVPTSSQGEKYVDLGKMKRVTVRPFKGQLYVDIREFYAAGPDEQKPGKKRHFTYC